MTSNREILRRRWYKVAALVASKYNIKVEDIYAPGRKGSSVVARHMTWKIIKDLYGSDASYNMIGNIFNRTHASALNGVRSISGQIDTYRNIRLEHAELLASARITLGIPDRQRSEIKDRLVEVLRCTNIVSARIELRRIMQDIKN